MIDHSVSPTEIRIPLHCGRCGRIFRDGERVRIIQAGPVASSDTLAGFVVKTQHVNKVVEHENIDHCTEPR